MILISDRGVEEEQQTRQPVKLETAGAAPVYPAKAGIAQIVEHGSEKPGVNGASPFSGTLR